jgi:prepilin-type N-terminal cleavage/methylation domain-containing protein
MKRRGGFTLIELLIVITLLGVILPLAGRMIYLLLRAQAASAEALTDSVTLTRFSQTFRRDVHAASGVAKSPGESSAQSTLALKVQSPMAVTYEFNPAGTVSRTVSTGSSIARREQFRIRRARIRFEVSKDGREIAAIQEPLLIGGASPGESTLTPSTIRVEAVLGRDHRFESPSLEPPKKSGVKPAEKTGARR